MDHWIQDIFQLNFLQYFGSSMMGCQWSNIAPYSAALGLAAGLSTEILCNIFSICPPGLDSILDKTTASVKPASLWKLQFNITELGTDKKYDMNNFSTIVNRDHCRSTVSNWGYSALELLESLICKKKNTNYKQYNL